MTSQTASSVNFLQVSRSWKYATTYKGERMHLIEEDVHSGQRADHTMCGLPANRVPLFMECARPLSILPCRTCEKAAK